MKCEKCGKELPINSKKNGVQYYYCRNCKMSCSDKPHEPKPLNFDAYVARQLVKNCIYKTNEFTHSKWTKNQIARLLGYRYQDIKNWLKLKNLPTISKKKFENYLENRENGYDILCVLGYRTVDNPSENLKKIVYRKAREKKDTSHIPKERDVFFHINEPEYLRLVNMTITNRKEAIFVLGALLGCRTREILGAKYTDIDYENKTIYFQRAISFEKESTDYEKLFEEAINAGAQDFVDEDDEYKVITSVENFQIITESLEKLGFKHKSAELTRLPENTIEITDAAVASNILKLMDKLEEHDDVQNVYSNFDISDEIMDSIQ